jgi:ferredoxin-NADP reductase
MVRNKHRLPSMNAILQIDPPSTVQHTPKPNPAEALRRKMHRAVLVDRRIFAAGRLGRFVLRVDPTLLGEYQAGQYIGIGLDVPGHGFTVRSYSIASTPLDSGSLELFVSLVPDGRLTPTIFGQAVGSTWYHLTPKGHFTLRKAAARTVVMIATGTGVAPFVGQIRTLWRLHRSGVPGHHRIVLFYGASHADEFGYREELERYAAARQDGFDFTLVCTASRPEAPGRNWTPTLGRGRVNELVRWVFGQKPNHGGEVALPAGLDRDRLAAHVLGDGAHHTAWMACGRPHMIDDLVEPARAVGVGSFLSEEFWKT